MRSVGRNECALTSGERHWCAIDCEIDCAAEDDRDLFFGMLMNGKNGTWLVDIAHQGLAGAVDRLPCDAIERMLDGDIAPVDGGWSRSGHGGQKTNQPQKRANASRKKKTLETPPPKIR